MTTTVLPSPPPAERLIPARMRIFHNNRPHEHGGGFRDGQKVTEVFSYVTTRPSADMPDEDLTGHAYFLLNVGDDAALGDPDTRAQTYRALGNRPLMVGDVVAVNDRFYSCESVGWRELSTEPSIVQQAGIGTTPLY